MKKLMLLLALGFMLSAGAQTVFEIPKNVAFKTAADYERYEADVVKAAKWLEETDLDKETEKRKAVNAFVLAWVSGTDKVTLTIESGLVKHTEDNVNLLGVYIAAYARYCIEHKGALAKDATRFAAESILKVYQKKIAIKKNKAMEKLAKAAAGGKLDEYLVKNGF